MTDKKEQVLIFTDGSSRGNPGQGGFGGVIVSIKDETICEYGGRKKMTTNNEMELLSVIEGLKLVQNKKSEIVIYSDSSYVVNGATKWVKNWITNGWKTSTKEPVANKEKWEILVSLLKTLNNTSWILLKGHSGIQGNERADEIATSMADDMSLLENETKIVFFDKFNKHLIGVKFLNLDQQTVAGGKSKSGKTKAYSYVSLVDGIIEKHKTWADCESRVKGKKARFKKAISEQDEKDIIQTWLEK